MKIAFIGGRNIHLIGGIESYMYNLCSLLVSNGFEPLVYCESDHDGEEMVNGFKVIHQKSPKSRYWVKPLLGLKAIIKTIRKHPDIKIYHFNAAGPAYFGWIARIFGKKTILQLHGIETRRTKWSTSERMIMNVTGSVARDFCTKYCTSVSLEQTEIVNNANAKKHCVYIPTAVNLPKQDIKSDVLQRYNLEAGKYFLYLGRLVHDKNPDYLIKAFNEAKIKDYKLVIAGSNDKEPKYVNELHELTKDNPNVVFTGAVYDDDKEMLLDKCYAFCIPSTIEGLAISLLEGMSYGKAVIASDIPANKEGLGEVALWVKAEDIETLKKQLIYACEHPKELEEMGKLNQLRVKEKFTWPLVARQYMDFVISIASK